MCGKGFAALGGAAWRRGGPGGGSRDGYAEMRLMIAFFSSLFSVLSPYLVPPTSTLYLPSRLLKVSSQKTELIRKRQ